MSLFEVEIDPRLKIVNVEGMKNIPVKRWEVDTVEKKRKKKKTDEQKTEKKSKKKEKKKILRVPSIFFLISFSHLFFCFFFSFF
jgi:hypothetical protein